MPEERVLGRLDVIDMEMPRFRPFGLVLKFHNDLQVYLQLPASEPLFSSASDKRSRLSLQAGRWNLRPY